MSSGVGGVEGEDAGGRQVKGRAIGDRARWDVKGFGGGEGPGEGRDGGAGRSTGASQGGVEGREGGAAPDAVHGGGVRWATVTARGVVV